MKWDKVKDTVVCNVRYMIIQARDFNIEANILRDLMGSNWEALRGCEMHNVRALYADKAAEAIDNWDIRAVERLRELFPHFFPSSLQKGKLEAFMGDSGDWEVIST